MRRRQMVKIRNWIGFVIVLAFFIAYLLPVFWLFLAGFKSRLDAFAVPPKWFFTPTLEHFRGIFTKAGSGSSTFFSHLLNSVIVTVATTLISVGVACYAGYALARIRPRGSEAIGLAILGARLFPPVSLLVPLFVIFQKLGILDTRLALILPYTALNIPLATMMMRGFFQELPKDLEDAAFVDGCNRWSAFHRIIMPLVLPALTATAVFSFILAWNDLLFAVSFTTFEAPTLPILVSRVRTEEGIMWGSLGALSLLVTIPTGIFTFLVQKWLVKGLASGAVKG
jgi:multiple sugar transport system permease protein